MRGILKYPSKALIIIVEDVALKGAIMSNHMMGNTTPGGVKEG
jgi:hypothetical protein